MPGYDIDIPMNIRGGIKKIFSKPKIAIGIALVIAIVIGLTSYIINKKTLFETFAQIDTISGAMGTQSSDLSTQNLTLAFPIGGRVQSVSVKIGDKVSAGEALATLDQSNSLAVLQSARGALAQAQANYNKILAAATPQDVAVSQAAVEVASTTLQNAKQNLLNEIQTAESNSNTAVLSITNNLFSNPESSSPQFSIPGTVQTNGQMVSNVNNERVVTNSTLLAWQTEASQISTNNVNQVVADSISNLSAISQYFADIINLLTTYSQSDSSGGNTILATDQSVVTGAKATIDSLSTSITNYKQAVQSAQSSLDSAGASLNLKQSPARSEDVQIGNAQVMSAQGQVDMAQANLNNTILRAPTDGIITQVDTKVGQQASANQEVIILQH